MKSSKRRKINGAAALLLASFILSVCVGVGFAAPMTGKLRTRGKKPVIVNGNKVNAGIAIFSGARIQSPENVGATVDLGVLGQLDLAPNTDLTLTFSAGDVSVDLRSGYVILTTKRRVKGIVYTSEGQVVQTDPSKLSSVVARTAGSLGPEASAPIGATSGGVGAGTAAGVAGAGAAAAAVGAAARKGSGRGRAVSPSAPPRP